ncbi:acyl-CoA reductase [Shewanella sp. NIFS-20-20]|uniref:acyl-CoA reductase n=1 Tax=Shewanella sp. NIFS-20-20 TaxID=2853806 RepID=UPI001C45B901|nr:acyl-CoA reductase [Shewanella sp. NIFS-20-20]MBV7316384.1 acyl-CoA reductase [Shewanella sp. NIFS-20-20]
MSWQWINPSATSGEAVSAFASQDIEYCHQLSRRLLSSKDIKQFPDLVALGYWLRRSNIEHLLAPYQQGPYQCRPLGRVFHSTPANVDSIFVYSSILSLLCGNLNVIRLSSRSGGSSELLVQAMLALAEEFAPQNARMQLVRCDYDAPELLSVLKTADARVLWGSDASIVAQRQQPFTPHGRELSFGHKFSICALDAKAVAASQPQTLSKLVYDFIKDNYTFAQQACSSAKAIAWCGSSADITAAHAKFWPELSSQVGQSPTRSASDLYQAEATSQALILADNHIHSYQSQAHFIRLGATGLTEQQLHQHGGNGVFIELSLNDLSELTPMLTQQHQTLSHWGFEPHRFQCWADAQLQLDRIVAVGQSLQFDPLWDGQDLIYSFSRLRRR